MNSFLKRWVEQDHHSLAVCFFHHSCLRTLRERPLVFCLRCWIWYYHIMPDGTCKHCNKLQIKKAAPQGTKEFCRGQAAAKWFGMVAGRQFIIVKWLVWVRGYHERDEVSMTCLEFWTFSRTYHVRFVELHKSKTSPDKPSGLCYTIKWLVIEKDGGLHHGREKHRRYRV